MRFYLRKLKIHRVVKSSDKIDSERKKKDFLINRLAVILNQDIDGTDDENIERFQTTGQYLTDKINNLIDKHNMTLEQLNFQNDLLDDEDEIPSSVFTEDDKIDKNLVFDCDADHTVEQFNALIDKISDGSYNIINGFHPLVTESDKITSINKYVTQQTAFNQVVTSLATDNMKMIVNFIKGIFNTNQNFPALSAEIPSI